LSYLDLDADDFEEPSFRDDRTIIKSGKGKCFVLKKDTAIVRVTSKTKFNKLGNLNKELQE